jgi:limonene-1,2-epoxide hydrolase
MAKPEDAAKPGDAAKPEDVVRAFCDAVSKRDAEVLRPLLADGAVYHNVGMVPSVGVEAVLANLEGQWQMFSVVYDFQVRNLAASGDVVLTERVDVVGADGGSMPVPVMGAFEVRDGRITHWRDYFDTGLIARMSAGDDVSDLVP